MTRLAPVSLALSFALSALPSYAGTLTISAVSPARHLVGAPETAAISATFDRAIDPATVTAASFWAFARWSGPVTGTRTVSPDGLTVTLTPDSALSAGESVMVILSEDLAALDGSPFRGAGYCWQFWVRSGLTPVLSYSEPDVLPTGDPSRPYGAIGSDLNGDGFLDLTTINEDTNDLRVFLNPADGSTTFGTFLTPSATNGSTPSPSEPTDFDRDGNVDVAVASTQAPSVSVLLGQGDGTFDSPQVLSVASTVRGLAVLDVDGDGDVDIAAANTGADQISISLNDGTGTFTAGTTFGSGNGGEWGLAAADMNDDGILDLVAGGSGGSSMVWVYGGNGDGTFSLLDSRDIGASTWMLVVGDVDGDGDEDISTASSSSVGVIVENGGDGTLISHDTYPIDSFGLATDLADLDGDGDLDWMTASFNGDWLIFTNDGDGIFTFDQEIPAPAAASCSVAMDIDNDGDLDLALIDEIANEVLILANQGSVFADGFESGDTTGWATSTP